MNIKILFQYHNNMYDTFQALSTLGTVQFLSYRISKLPPDIPNIKPKQVGKRPFIAYNPFHLWKLLNNTDVLIVKHVNDPINIIPYIICLIRGITCVVIAQQMRKYEGSWKIPFILYVYLLRLLEIRVLAMTKQAYNVLKPLIPKTVYAPACIDAKRFCPHIKKYNVEDTDSLSILCVAKYQRRKNLDMLIRAFGRLVKMYPNFDLKLTIVGSVGLSQAYRMEHERLKDIVQQLDLESKVHLLYDVDHVKMPIIYNDADLFILPATQEPLGYAVVEAMACGLPIIVSSDVGASSYVYHGYNGYIITSLSERTITQAIESFIERDGCADINKITLYGNQSDSIIKQHHSPEAFLQQFTLLLN